MFNPTGICDEGDGLVAVCFSSSRCHGLITDLPRIHACDDNRSTSVGGAGLTETISDVEHTKEISIEYCKFGTFHEGFIFAKLSICEVS